MSKPLVVITTGLPGSGKTTWARERAAGMGDIAMLTSRDDIRKMIGCFPVGTKEQENLVSKIQDDSIVQGVKAGMTVFIHDTNLNQKSPKRIKRLFDGDVEFLVSDHTNVPVEECIRRDALRENPVGAGVIRQMARQLNKPWRLTNEWMNDIVLSEPYTPRFQRPKAILVDLDGTLAEHVARSPYDYSRVKTDGVHKPIRKLVNGYHDSGFAVIGLSGRPDINNVRRDTEEWMQENDIRYDRLLMRPADMLTDNDADVKQHLFDKHIRNSYDVELMLDDRNRVVRRMRKLGIKVLQVADGDF